MKKLWMMLSKDKYSFPELCADSAKELSELTGTKEATIRSIAYRMQTGEFKYGRFACVNVGEENEDED